MSFLQYTGSSETQEDGSCEFQMENENVLKDEEGYIEVTSPAIDNTFQTIFGQNKNITKDLLNSFIYPNEDRIKEVTFLPTNFSGQIGAKFSLGSIRADVLCKCDLQEDENDKDLELIVDLEMQIEFNKQNTQRFINYFKTLISNYGKVNIIILALVFRDVPNPYINKGTKTYIEELRIESNEEKNLFDEFPIYQIDISSCYSLIFKKNEQLGIISKDKVLNDKGKEWIKFFNIPNWCGFYKKDYYAFPKLKNMSFKSNEVCKALEILSKMDKTQYEMHLIDWSQYLKNNELFEKLKKENEAQKEKLYKQKEKINDQKEEIKRLKKLLNMVKNKK